MNIVWSSIAVGLFAVAAGAAVAGGEPAMAELRLAEAATLAARASTTTVGLLEANEMTATQAGPPAD